MGIDLIVEIGNSHEGSLGIAMSFVDMVAEAGAKTVKFQMHLPEYESSVNEPFRIQFSKQDKTRSDYWKRVGFSQEEWLILINYVDKLGLEFLCSPFSVEAAKWLFDTGQMRRWKIGSGEATNFPLLDFLIETDLPILLSTGLVSWQELLDIKKRLDAKNYWNKVTLLHCVSMYPTELENSSLNVIDDLRTLDCKVGLSDHSGQIAVPLLAFSRGVSTIEIHMTPHKKFFGPDTTASLTPEELALLIKLCDQFSILSKNAGSRDSLFELSRDTASLFRKGIYWKHNLPKDHVVTFDDLAFLKPASFFEAKDYEKILGQTTLLSVEKGQSILPNDLK